MAYTLNIRHLSQLVRPESPNLTLVDAALIGRPLRGRRRSSAKHLAVLALIDESSPFVEKPEMAKQLGCRVSLLAGSDLSSPKANPIALTIVKYDRAL